MLASFLLRMMRVTTYPAGQLSPRVYMIVLNREKCKGNLAKLESFLGLLVSKGVVDERQEDSFDFNGRTKQDLVQWCVSFDGQRTVTTVIEHPDQSEKSAGYDEDYLYGDYIGQWAKDEDGKGHSTGGNDLDDGEDPAHHGRGCDLLNEHRLGSGHYGHEEACCAHDE